MISGGFNFPWYYSVTPFLLQEDEEERERMNRFKKLMNVAEEDGNEVSVASDGDR